MRKHYTVLLLFFTLHAAMGQEWKALSPLPTTHAISYTSFINDQEGWISVLPELDHSRLWHTVDGGITWESQWATILPQSGAAVLDFADEQTGYAYVAGGSDGPAIYKTENGGNTWQVLIMPGEPAPELFFLNADTGFVSGFGEIYKTTNGGDSWLVYQLPGSFGLPVSDLQFVNGLVGIATMKDYENSVIRTADGGVTWTIELGIEDYYMNALYFVNVDTGYVCGYYDGFEGDPGVIYRTINGGQTWSQQYFDEGYGLTSFSDIHFRNGLEGIALGNMDLYTTDGGATWHEFDAIPDWFVTLDGHDALYLFGTAGTFMRWEEDPLVFTEISRRFGWSTPHLSFVNSETGWMTDSEAGLWKTNDGGNTWALLDGTDLGMNFIDAVSENVIFGVAAHQFDTDTIFASLDGGATMQMLFTNSVMDVNSIQMINENVGFIASADGSVWKTVNGGSVWTSTVLTDYEVMDVFFLNENEGWAITGTYFDKKIYHTTNSGETWSLQFNYNGNGYFNKMYFADDQHGWVTIYQGTTKNYVSTANGGQTWTTHALPDAYYGGDVFFSDPMHGYMTADDFIYETTDGGDSWSKVYDDVLNIARLEAAGTDVIFATGYYGYVVRLGSCAVTAAFEASATGINVQFTDQTTDAVAWSWEFGDGSTSNLQNPTHTYADEGEYEVCLAAVSDCGMNTVCKTYTFCNTLNTDFSFLATNLSVQFLNIISEANDFLWDFGDGIYASNQNPSHTFGDEGVYAVCLTEMDACTSENLCKEVIVCEPMNVSFDYSSDELTVQFTATPSNAVNWSWNFGDGLFSTDANPVHVYAMPGSYEVCLHTANLCTTDSTCQTINLVTTSSEAAQKGVFTFSAAPNPFKDNLIIAYDLLSDQEIAVQITDVCGRILYTSEQGIKQGGKHTEELNLGQFAGGLYFLQARLNGSTQTITIVKE